MVMFFGVSKIIDDAEKYYNSTKLKLICHLKEFRKDFNLTQKKLAELVGVSRETIVFLEQGIYNPSLQLAYKISKVFDVEIEEIFSFLEPKS